MKNIKKSPKETLPDWSFFPQFYFLSAKVLCKQLQKRANFINESRESSYVTNCQICEDNGFPLHPNYYLIFPIIFNLKHGIELCIKSLSHLDYDGYLPKHDYKELFDCLIKDVKNTNNKAIFEKLKKETWPIIKKYYFGTYIPENMEWDADIQNQAERYPHRKNCYKIPYNYDWVTESLVNMIIDDIDFLQGKFHEAWIKTKDNDPIYNDPEINNPEAFLEKINDATAND